MIIQHNTGKAELCFVKVPESKNGIEITIHGNERFLNVWGVEDIKLPSGNWQIVGNPFELTEQVCRCFVQEVDHPYDYQYIDYEHHGKLYLTAKRSMQSLLESLKIYETNPYGNLRLQDSDAGSELETEIYPRWKIAQERTGSFILLKKI